jgi:gliding motility-associated-like protein
MKPKTTEIPTQGFTNRLRGSIAFFVFIFLSISSSLFAQPPNDSCHKAIEIAISANGYDAGTFVGSAVDITDATREIGEECSEDISKIGNCNKTVWYSFYIPTTRNVELRLTQQDSAIPQIFAGFSIYKAKECLYNKGNISTQLTPIAKFGASGNTCLQSGFYYIQVAAKNRAKGELWVELTLDDAVSPSFDHYNSPHDFGIMNNESKTEYFDLTCLSITKEEETGIGNTSYNKSLWVKVNFPKNGFMYQLSLINNNRHDFGYRIFTSPPTSDSVLGSKPFTYHTYRSGFSNQIRLVEEKCYDGSTDQTFYVQLIFKNETQYNTTIQASSYDEIKDPWNTPAEPLKITTIDRYNQTFEKYFDCTGELATHTCKSSIPDYYTQNSRFSQEQDTFAFGSYIVIDNTEPGELRINAQDKNRYGYNLNYALYEGDITQNCNLTEVSQTAVSSSFSACLEKKVYTLVLAKTKDTYLSNYIKLSVSFNKKPVNIDYNYHTNVENLGTVDPSTDDYPPPKSSVYINSRDTSIQIGDSTWTGRFTFKEFYVAESGNFSIVPSNSYPSLRHFIFEGRYSDNNVAKIPELSYDLLYSYSNFNTCHNYKKGYYTIISIYDTATYGNYNLCNVPNSYIIFQKQFSCTQYNLNTNAKDASPIHNNQSLTSSPANKVSIRYEYPVNYCKDCYSQTLTPPALPNNHCYRYMPEDNLFFYYTFYIDKNTEVELPYNSLLYEGNVKSDPSICQDTNNIMEPCAGNVFCNLQGGKTYSMVLYRVGYTPMKIIATPHILSPNDFAKNTYDFGNIDDLNTKIAPYYPITCNTTSAATDPSYSGVQYRARFNIPYPDTLNKADYKQRRNLWYTFTVSDASSILVQVNSTEFCNQDIVIYRYTGDPLVSFENVLSAGFDSTTTGLELVVKNGRESSTNCNYSYVDFSNSGCTYNRYFVLLEGNNSPNNTYQLTVKKTARPIYSDSGNNCSNAITKTTSILGTYHLQTLNNCHTYGDSPFEDEKDNRIKSSWFFLDVKNLDKFDLSIKYSGAVPITKYIVYAGSCGALTRVAELNDQFSFFTLSCMKAGSYYVQAISPTYSLGSVAFDFTISTAKNAKCKAYDFEIPLAQFELRGGCNNDTLLFKNLSTQGDDIALYWYLNGQLQDSTLDLTLLKTAPEILENNTLKLVVVNKNSKYSDSMSLAYEKDTTQYYFNILDPGNPRCSDTIQLGVRTNYKHRLNYIWNTPSNPYEHFEPTPFITRISNGNIYVEATSDNCIFKDTLELLTNPDPGLFTDTILCGDSSKLLYDLSETNYFRVNGMNITGSSWNPTSSGIYHLYFWYSGCYYMDTLEVTYGAETLTISEKDTVSICNNKPTTLKYAKELIDYNWNTGSTADSITVTQMGDYWLKGSLFGCKELEYYITVLKDSVPKVFLKDTTVCENEIYQFVNPTSFGVTERSPNLDSFKATTSTPLYMTIEQNGCSTTDTALLSVIPAPNQNLVKEYCFEEDSLLLDAFKANSYDWLDGKNTTRYLIAHEYKTYTVIRENMNGCIDSITFEISTNCPSKVFIPNSFTPNEDGLNSSFKPIIFGKYSRYTMQIYNRWGEKLYETNDGTPWNGYSNGAKVQQGSYFAIIVVTFNSSGRTTTEHFTTTITVLY